MWYIFISASWPASEELHSASVTRIVRYPRSTALNTVARTHTSVSEPVMRRPSASLSCRCSIVRQIWSVAFNRAVGLDRAGTSYSDEGPSFRSALFARLISRLSKRTSPWTASALHIVFLHFAFPMLIPRGQSPGWPHELRTSKWALNARCSRFAHRRRSCRGDAFSWFLLLKEALLLGTYSGGKWVNTAECRPGVPRQK